MGAINEADLKKAISSKTFSNSYLIYGDENYLKQHYVSRMKKALVAKGTEDFNLHVIDGKNAELSQIYQCAQALPLMSEYVCVVVNDFPLDKLTTSQKKEFSEFLSEISETTVLIFWMDNINVDLKTSSWKTIVGYFTKYGDSVNLARRDVRSLCKMLCDGAKKRSCVLSPYNAEYMVSQVGNDLQTLLNEIEKLCAYVPQGEITRDVIDKVVTKSIAAKAFDLSKALVRMDYESAYNILNNLLALKEEPISILGAVSTAYIDLYRVKCAKIAGKQSTNVGKYYNYKGREFRLTNASRDCDKLSILQLRASVDALLAADVKLKSSSVDARLVLEETMVKLLLIAKGEKI